MKKSSSILLVLFSFFLANTAIAQSDGALPMYSKVYDEQRNPFDDSEVAIALAKKNHKNVLMVVGGNWCSFCKKMDTFIKATPEVSDALYKNFVVVKINMSEDNKNEEFLKSLPEITSYPHVFISTAAGKIIFSKNTLDLQIKGAHVESKWLNFINTWQPKQS